MLQASGSMSPAPSPPSPLRSVRPTRNSVRATASGSLVEASLVEASLGSLVEASLDSLLVEASLDSLDAPRDAKQRQASSAKQAALLASSKHPRLSSKHPRLASTRFDMPSHARAAALNRRQVDSAAHVQDRWIQQLSRPRCTPLSQAV